MPLAKQLVHQRQLGEHLPYKQEVTGSSPVSSIESLAQLVEHLTFNQRVGSSSQVLYQTEPLPEVCTLKDLNLQPSDSFGFFI